MILNKGNTTAKNQTYWDEFLGDYAGKNRGEDRLFATSLAINALIDTWTIKEKKSSNSSFY